MQRRGNYLKCYFYHWFIWPNSLDLNLLKLSVSDLSYTLHGKLEVLFFCWNIMFIFMKMYFSFFDGLWMRGKTSENIPIQTILMLNIRKYSDTDKINVEYLNIFRYRQDKCWISEIIPIQTRLMLNIWKYSDTDMINVEYLKIFRYRKD